MLPLAEPTRDVAKPFCQDPVLAFLKVLKGSNRGKVLELHGERVVLGRNPGCQVVLDNVAVSREHAAISCAQGQYYLEDLHSRNRTFLNGEEIASRVPLQTADRIKICGLVFGFYTHMPLEEDSDKTPFGRRIHSADIGLGEEPSDDGESGTNESSVITTLNATSTSRLRLSVKPEVKLRAVLEIGQALGQVLDLDEVLNKLLRSLFRIFPQADEGFVMLKDPVSGRLRLQATKTRGLAAAGQITVSTTVVKQAMDTGTAILSEDALEDSRFKKSESLSDLRIRSMMCVPLLGKSGQPLGVMQIDTKDVSQQFSQNDLDVLVSVAAQASLAVENAQLHAELLRQRDVQRELEFATQVQVGFLPKERPRLPEFEFFEYYQAARNVGGDFCDYVKLDEHRVAVALGDVAGKGVPAALLMARLYSDVRYHLLTSKSVSDAMVGLNNEMTERGLGNRFITFLIFVVDQKSHQVTSANAGHLPLLFRRAGGRVDACDFKRSGLPLGIERNQKFRETRTKLAPGDVCLAYTDGVTEAMNLQRHLYGTDRLLKYLEHAPPTAEALVTGLVDDITDFRDTQPPADDICIVAVSRTAESQ